MKVLGLHFGHDAGVALIEDGAVRFLAQAERLTRQKHASGLSYGLIKDVMSRAGLTAGDIDYCAVTTTQAMSIVLERGSPLSISYARHEDDQTRSLLADLIAEDKSLAAQPLEHILDPVINSPKHLARRNQRKDAVLKLFGIPAERAEILSCYNRYVYDLSSPLARLSPIRQLAEDYTLTADDLDQRRYDFNFPVTITLDGHSIPGSMITHHAAHAAAAFYQSPFERSAIMTLDGGWGQHEGGLFWYGDGRRIMPVRIHYLELGQLYLNMGNYTLKMGDGGEGKMMGLSSYGRPVFYDERFVANSADPIAANTVVTAWGAHITDLIRAAGDKYDRTAIAVRDKMLSPVNADIAASTQKLFEETMLESARQMARILETTGLATDSISLSGGCMLNCPTNTRISNETVFRNVFVEPACDDGGLPVGAALWVYHNLMDQPRRPADPVKRGLPYYGLPLRDSDIDQALEQFKADIVVERPSEFAATCARLLSEGQVVGWFEGRSEIGPRALGHRSIVADPRGDKTWARVNAIKGREAWRPLAPSVLREHAEEWFSGLPADSPFMMFTGTVRKPGIPAITHVDNTARVQTVTPECGGYYDLLKAFHALTGCAVVLNTSMNGPGQPIAEFPADAIGMLLDGRFDVLALQGLLIRRRGG